MRIRFVGVICAIALGLSISNRTMAQEGYHRLNVNDFQGVPRATGDNAIAYTHCSIDYHYHVIGERNNYTLTFNVQLILDKDQSWLDRRRVTSQQLLTQILKHEQGHYTIAFMEQQEILREAHRTHFDANYQAEATALFNRIHAKYEKLNQNYDDDTHHMLDDVQQHSWDVYFEKRLAFMPSMDLAKE